MSVAAPILAHGTGWDEFLVLLSPIVIFSVLRLVDRRQRGRAPKEQDQGEA